MKSLHKTVKDLLIKLIKNIPKKTNRGRPLKEPIEHYIDAICYVLKTGIPWIALEDTRFNLHWTTYHKKFLLWSEHKVFEQTYSSILDLLQNKNILTPATLQDLYIDSSMIKNIKGVDFLGCNHYDRGRLGNKITSIITGSGIPLSITIDKANIHDTKITEKAIKNTKINIAGSRLIADKGYISTALKKRLKKKYKVNLIYPYRDNQMKKNTKAEKKLLKSRCVVEHFFSWIKNYRRLRNRYDKKSSSFLQFCYLGYLDVIANKIKSL